MKIVIGSVLYVNHIILSNLLFSLSALRTLLSFRVSFDIQKINEILKMTIINHLCSLLLLFIALNCGNIQLELLSVLYL